MPNYTAVDLRDKRYDKLSNSTKSVNNVLLGMTRMCRIEERGSRHRLDDQRVT